MRMYLSSYQLGNKPHEFVDMIGNKNKRVAVIVNASDSCDSNVRKEQVEKQIENMHQIGLLPEELDLRDYFVRQHVLEDKLQEFSSVWVKGGNVFVLKRALEQSSFDVVIKRMLGKDQLVYGGYSAGICILAPKLNGYELVDSVADIPTLCYKPEFSWEGLSLIDYSPLPHYDSNHPESHLIEKVLSYMVDNSMPFKTLKDGQAIVINNNNSLVIG